MKTALRLFLLTAAVLAVLATVALVGILQWWSVQDTVRLIIDGQPVQLHIGEDVGWVTVTAGVALAMLLVFLLVPLVVVLALVVSAAATVLSLAAAFSPVLLLGALGWWILNRLDAKSAATSGAARATGAPSPWAPAAPPTPPNPT